jgi:hypothetical protein
MVARYGADVARKQLIRRASDRDLDWQDTG